MYHTDFVCVTDAKNLDYAALQGMNISVGCKLSHRDFYHREQEQPRGERNNNEKKQRWKIAKVNSWLCFLKLHNPIVVSTTDNLRNQISLLRLRSPFIASLNLQDFELTSANLAQRQCVKKQCPLVQREELIPQ
ncbi:hypothetical protein NC652_005842 [Populus alba x Populus x berolinensis]|nr:hypothetical protein NC652_005842 [Populus alba x Populus x berolinensis]